MVLTTHYLDEADRLANRVLVLAAGRVVADTTPAELRSRSGPTTVRFPLPSGVAASDLPPALAPYVPPGEHLLLARSGQVNAVLRELLGWADRRGLDLSGLEVGPPSLEDAYLALAGSTFATKAESHA